MIKEDIYPPFWTIEYLYEGGYYTKEQIKEFVELESLTKEQYTELTGDKYPYKDDEWESPQA